MPQPQMKRSYTPQQEQSAEVWAKQVCDRVFSHYTEKEMEEMRRRNLAAKQAYD